MFRLNMWRNQDASDWKSISHSFCHAVDICIYTGIISGKKPPGSSITTLHFISNKHSTMLIAQSPYQLQKAIVGNGYSTNTFNRFYNNCSYFLPIGLKIFLQFYFIIEGKK